jgi:hypothetical protein
MIFPARGHSHRSTNQLIIPQGGHRVSRFRKLGYGYLLSAGQEKGESRGVGAALEPPRALLRYRKRGTVFGPSQGQGINSTHPKGGRSRIGTPTNGNVSEQVLRDLEMKGMR